MRLLTSTIALLAAACALRLYKIGNALGRASLEPRGMSGSASSIAISGVPDALLADCGGRR